MCESHHPSRDEARTAAAQNVDTPVREVQYLLMQNNQGGLLLQRAQPVEQAVALPVSCIAQKQIPEINLVQSAIFSMKSFSLEVCSSVLQGDRHILSAEYDRHPIPALTFNLLVVRLDEIYCHRYLLCRTKHRAGVLRRGKILHAAMKNEFWPTVPHAHPG